MHRKTLLSVDTNAKTVKNGGFGYLTGILYMAPANLADPKVNLCPSHESANCLGSCLYYAGMGAFSNVQEARIAKTKYYLEEGRNKPEGDFWKNLILDIKALIKKAEKKELIPTVRLNGTTDIIWQKEAVMHEGKLYKNIHEIFPEIQFNEYTKVPNQKDIPPNVHMTFSYSGEKDYQKVVKKGLMSGMNVAMVAHDSIDLQLTILKYRSLKGFDLISGDEHDLRHLDGAKKVIWLSPKGFKAKKTESAFVLKKVA